MLIIQHKLHKFLKSLFIEAVNINFCLSNTFIPLVSWDFQIGFFKHWDIFFHPHDVLDSIIRCKIECIKLVADECQILAVTYHTLRRYWLYQIHAKSVGWVFQGISICVGKWIQQAFGNRYKIYSNWAKELLTSWKTHLRDIGSYWLLQCVL